jgi:hypothetical protein
MPETTHDRADPGLRRAALSLLVACVVQGLLVIGHFVYGAHLYDDPGRYHVVMPSIIAIVLVSALTALLVRRPGRILLTLLLVVAVPPFVLMFGIMHGAWFHVMKLVLFAGGASKETLEWLFMSPDYTVPNDFLYEATGILNFLIACYIAFRIVRLVSAFRAFRASYATGRASSIGSEGGNIAAPAASPSAPQR